MSDSVRPHRRQPTRLPRPWDSPGKNTGVGCHFLLQCMKMKSESEFSQLCQTLCDPVDCSPPGFSIHGIFQARVLEWVAIAFSIYIYTHIYICKNMHIYILHFIDTKMLLIVTYSINIKAFIRKYKHCINATFYKIYSGFGHHKNSDVLYEGVWLMELMDC